VSIGRFSPDLSLEQVLETAMAFEAAAHRFYRELAEKVREEIRPLVRELANEEERHYEQLRSLVRNENLVDHLLKRIDSPPTLPAFDALVCIPELPDDPIDEDVLTYAAHRERIAYEHYGYLAETTPAGPVQALFQLLRDEEVGHISALQAREVELLSIL
jgi:rubrerythrin